MAIKAEAVSIAEELISNVSGVLVTKNKVIGLKAYDTEDAKRVFEFTQNSVLTGKGISITPDGILTVPNAISSTTTTGRISVIDTKTGTEYKTADSAGLSGISVGTLLTLT